ncbi:MAG: ANTAR domain-containing protein [Acidimicrobiales bacterium]
MGCTADAAFALIKKQSLADNRKIIEVAADIVGRVQRRR